MVLIEKFIDTQSSMNFSFIKNVVQILISDLCGLDSHLHVFLFSDLSGFLA